jgi:hypothetical protein
MTFTLSCSCGKTITVDAAQAGAEVRCLCGKLNGVPSLSELRYGAGQARYDVSAVDRIRQKVAEGSLPTETECVKCGSQTQDILFSFIECERPWITGGAGFWQIFFAALVLPYWFLLRMSNKAYDNPRVFGRETVVETPLRMCLQCQSAVRGSHGVRALAELIRKVPLYEELLREFPEAEIGVSSKKRNLALCL